MPFWSTITRPGARPSGVTGRSLNWVSRSGFWVYETKIQSAKPSPSASTSRSPAVRSQVMPIPFVFVAGASLAILLQRDFQQPREHVAQPRLIQVADHPAVVHERDRAGFFGDHH